MADSYSPLTDKSYFRILTLELQNEASSLDSRATRTESLAQELNIGASFSEHDRSAMYLQAEQMRVSADRLRTRANSLVDIRRRI